MVHAKNPPSFAFLNIKKTHRTLGFILIDGFTLIELIVTVLLVGVLAITALPLFSDLSRAAKISTLNGLASSMKSTVTMIQSKALVEGLSPAAANPNRQTEFILDFNGRRSEVDWRNLCPESLAELGDRLTMLDHIKISHSSGLQSQINNRYTLVGYDIPGFSIPSNRGCYLVYDSFGSPACTVNVVVSDC